MHKATFHMASEQDTERFGSALATLLRPRDVVGLCGDLGAGKTFLARAIARGLGVPEEIPVTSPSFTLIKEYDGRMPIYHMDLYRLGSRAELYDLGLWEYYDGDGVCLVEWSDRFEELWPASALVLSIALGQGERRTVNATGTGRGAELVRGLSERFSKSPT